MPEPQHTLDLPPAFLVPSPQRARRVARRLSLMLLLFILAAAFAPWQQTVSGAGSVVAFSPNQRQQGIEAPVSGVVAKWHVREGSQVKAGDPVVELRDNDPSLLSRLDEERSALNLRLGTQQARVSALRDRVESLRSQQRAEVSAAESEVEIAQQELAAAQQKLQGDQAELEANELNLKRQRDLQGEGLTSRRDFELAELAVRRSSAQVTSSQAAVEGARSRLDSRRAALARVRASSEADISNAQASLQEAESEVASGKATMARVAIGISRQASQTVTAPTDGTILRVLVRQGAEQVSQGEPLAILVPNTEDRAVELYVDGNNAALIKSGDNVRLQFEGWPAVQFSGWPSVAVGTFGGRVAFVDSADDGQGNFRVLVKPNLRDDPWPSPVYLRQGVRTKGWFLLKQVSLGFELWRRFNGFPPTATPAKEKAIGGGKTKAERP